eukprot:CAMPEP_0118985168 /NCGR_PEP_ID=MMETSP1173-20130426/39366_1 /TAXON_ID=1034831 /ORGANISM="Rhizochromulina marina cf, Strain CCMP1243" /LENGTH=96 /DNA_ID=CAMNT_0006935873 /DNA_START=152 /DNA_END=442 /DNA_ORIENTATION=-
MTLLSGAGSIALGPCATGLYVSRVCRRRSPVKVRLRLLRVLADDGSRDGLPRGGDRRIMRGGQCAVVRRDIHTHGAKGDTAVADARVLGTPAKDHQ